MSNKPSMAKKAKLTIIPPPTKLRIFNHIGDMAGCGHIRVVYPAMILNTYYSKKYQFESVYNNRYIPHPSAYDQSSWVTFQRSATKQQLEIIKHFKKVRPQTPIIYELDDDLMNIPEWNFAHSFYANNQDNIKSILKQVTGIVCSTENLKRLLIKYNKNISVSPNHLPRFIWGETMQPNMDKLPNQKVKIVYAGSFNHFDNKSDKGDFSTELIDFVKKTLDIYEWIFVGGMPVSLKDNDKIRYYDWQPVHLFPRFLKSLRADIMLAPLSKETFNLSKSNIKALESVAVGCPLIATKFGPYENIPHSVSEEEFISTIETFAASEDHRQLVWNDQYNHLKDQLYWEDNDFSNMYDYINKHLRLLGKKLDI